MESACRAPFERPDKVQLRQEIKVSRGDPLQRSVEVIGMVTPPSHFQVSFLMPPASPPNSAVR